MEHLVENHHGGYYISSEDPEVLEAYCESCNDYDKILASWNEDEENGRINGLLRYFLANVLNNREDIDQRVSEYLNGPIYDDEVISCMINDIETDSDEIYDILAYLNESHSISDEEEIRIFRIAHFEEERQINMIKHFEKDMIKKDKNGRVQILRLSDKKNNN